MTTDVLLIMMLAVSAIFYELAIHRQRKRADRAESWAMSCDNRARRYRLEARNAHLALARVEAVIIGGAR